MVAYSKAGLAKKARMLSGRGAAAYNAGRPAISVGKVAFGGPLKAATGKAIKREVNIGKAGHVKGKM